MNMIDQISDRSNQYNQSSNWSIQFDSVRFLHQVPLILGIWGGKGQGKSFQCELVFAKMGIT